MYGVLFQQVQLYVVWQLINRSVGVNLQCTDIGSKPYPSRTELYNMVYIVEFQMYPSQMYVDFGECLVCHEFHKYNMQAA